MDPERFKGAGKAKTTPAETAPAPSPTPPPTAPSVALLEPSVGDHAPELVAEPIVGELDPVTDAVLGEIPERPKKAEVSEPTAPAVTSERATTRRKGLPLAVPVGAVLLGVVALAVGSTRARRGAPPVPSTPTPPPTPTPAPAPAPRASGLVIGG